jgi:hypothetical protein
VDYYQIKIGSGEWSDYTEDSVISITSNTNATYSFRAVSVSGVAGTESTVTIKYWNTIDDPEVVVSGTPEDG